MAFTNANTDTSLALSTSLSTGISALVARYKRYRVYRETLDGLNALTTRDLADLGLCRSELRFVAKQAADRA